MISGGTTDGDSNQARKGHLRQLQNYSVTSGQASTSKKSVESPIITFGPQDLIGVEVPHDDALIVHAIISNYRVKKTLVDTGSSVNIMFKTVLKGLQIEEELYPIETSLFGFTGYEVTPLDQITLPVTMGTKPLARTRRTTFVVVDAESPYNIILGRPTLTAFQAVVSTYHQKLKFPCKGKVGEAQGDQPEARKCYVTIVQADSRKTRRIQEVLQIDNGVQQGITPAMVEAEEDEKYKSILSTRTKQLKYPPIYLLS